jgi:hypothetical protein
MLRRWTGWVLTAAAVAAGPAPALSSNDPSNPYGQDGPPSIMAVQPPRAGIWPIAGGDGDYTNCLELTASSEAMAVHSGRVLVLEQPYPASRANRDLRFNADTSSGADESLRRAIEHGKGVGGQAMLPSLSEGKLMPEGSAQPEHVRAACGIPGGMTLLLPTNGIVLSSPADFP